MAARARHGQGDRGRGDAPQVRAVRRGRDDGVGVGPAGGRRVPVGALRVDGAAAGLHPRRGAPAPVVPRHLPPRFGEVPGLERVEALVDVANPASQRVLEKAGFTREAVLRKYGAIKGVVRDMVMSSFIDTDPVVPE